MNSAPEKVLSRKQVAIRLLYTILYLVILTILKFIIQLITLFQFIYLLIALRYSKPARKFSNRVIAYAYQVMRYLTLNANERPFPFMEFPGELEAPVEEVSFA
jgi:D-alanyl-lipoteichoic acid acyltransferase DltB (MBOAT superfamily)